MLKVTLHFEILYDLLKIRMILKVKNDSDLFKIQKFTQKVKFV